MLEEYNCAIVYPTYLNPKSTCVQKHFHGWAGVTILLLDVRKYERIYWEGLKESGYVTVHLINNG